MSASTPHKEQQQEIVGHRNSPEAFGWLRCRLSLEIPVEAFTVGDLLRLEIGSIVGTKITPKDDIPLRANGVAIARVQFETIANRLAIRITELE